MTTTFVAVSELCDVNPQPSKGLAPDEPVAFVSMADLDEERGVAIDTTTRPYREVAKGYTPFRTDDLLVAKITPCFQNGKIGVARTSTPQAFGSTEFHVLRPLRDRVNPRYLYHFLRRPDVRRHGEIRMTGAGGQRRVPTRFFDELTVPLPALAEQWRIAAVLDAADALRTKRREALSKLDTLTCATFVDMFGDPTKNTDRWPIVELGKVLESTTYGTAKKSGANGRFPVLGMGNVSYAGQIDPTGVKYVDLEEKERSKHLVHAGDVLFNRTNSADLVGKTAVYRGAEPMAYAGYLIRLRTTADLHPEYLGTYMNLPTTKQLLRSMCRSIVGMANINAKEVRAIRIPLPPIDRQSAFADHRDAIWHRRQSAVRQVDELDTLFASLQQRAFRGEL